MRPGIRDEKAEFREAPGSTWDPDSGNVSKRLVKKPSVVGVKPHLACDT